MFTYDLVAHLKRQRAFSLQAFGPGLRTEGVTDHIRKELDEVRASAGNVHEWIDVILLALDGAWRTGASPEDICAMLERKQGINEIRDWPDWRTAPPDKAIEHVREPANYRLPENFRDAAQCAPVSYRLPGSEDGRRIGAPLEVEPATHYFDPKDGRDVEAPQVDRERTDAELARLAELHTRVMAAPSDAEWMRNQQAQDRLHREPELLDPLTAKPEDDNWGYKGG